MSIVPHLDFPRLLSVNTPGGAKNSLFIQNCAIWNTTIVSSRTSKANKVAGFDVFLQSVHKQELQGSELLKCESLPPGCVLAGSVLRYSS